MNESKNIPDVSLSVTPDEMQFVLHVLGKLPTEANAWPLLQKLKGQFQVYAATAQRAPAESDVVTGSADVPNVPSRAARRRAK